MPDLAVEVISPDDTAREIATKLREYRLAGFPLVWVVEPEQRIVTVYPNPGKPFTLSEDDEIRAESALPGVRLPGVRPVPARAVTARTVTTPGGVL